MNSNLLERKLIWDPKIPIDFPETNNIQTDINCHMKEILIWKGKQLTYQYLQSITEIERDEIAKDLLNFFIKYDFMKYRQEETEIQRIWGQLKNANPLELKQMEDGIHIDNNHRMGDKIYKYFFPNILKIGSPKRKSVYECITNKEDLFHIIRNRIGNTLLYNTKGRPARQWPMTITPAMIIQGAKCSGYASMGSIFKPIVAKTVYTHHIKENQNILDYSCGFGTRLLGLMALGLPNVHYYGYEPNTETYKNLLNMVKYFNFSDNVHIKCAGSEEGGIKVPIHFAFSSPCYFNTEIYSIEDTQCYNKYPKYEDWLEKYWRQTVKHIKNQLVSDGIFAVNIGNKSNIKMKKIALDFKQIIEEEGFKLIKTWWMDTQKSHLSNKKQTKVITKPEGIYFYGIG